MSPAPLNRPSQQSFEPSLIGCESDSRTHSWPRCGMRRRCCHDPRRGRQPSSLAARFFRGEDGGARGGRIALRLSGGRRAANGESLRAAAPRVTFGVRCHQIRRSRGSKQCHTRLCRLKMHADVSKPTSRSIARKQGRRRTPTRRLRKPLCSDWRNTSTNLDGLCVRAISTRTNGQS